MTPEQADNRFLEHYQDHLEYARDLDGMPSEWIFEQNLDDLIHALNTLEDESIPKLPDDLIAYKIGRWANKQVPPNHDLVEHAEEYRGQLIALDFQNADNTIINNLLSSLKTILNDEDFRDISSDIKQSLEYQEKDTELDSVYMVSNADLYIGLYNNQENAVILTTDGSIKVYHIDTLKRDNNKETDEMKHLLLNSPKETINKSQLHSIIGNELTSMIFPDDEDTISILDLP